MEKGSRKLVGVDANSIRDLRLNSHASERTELHLSVRRPVTRLGKINQVYASKEKIGRWLAFWA